MILGKKGMLMRYAPLPLTSPLSKFQQFHIEKLEGLGCKGMAIVGIPYVNLEKMMAILVMGLCCFLASAASDGVRAAPSEVQALRIARRSLIDPFNNLRNWGRGDPCTSNWTGIICYNTTLDDGLLHVREILLLTRNLSGSLSPALGNLSYLKILDFMWNDITGSIPTEIGNLASLELLLLSGNQLTGPLPDELGNLSHMNRIQIDQNQISGPVPASFANLENARHFHMNNNSLSGQIPPELSRLPKLVHLLLDNNNLSGYIPPELSELPSIQIIQLDNNNFGETTIPSQLGNVSTLLKLSLRNCSLRGPIPDMSNNTRIAYIDLSQNQLEGNVPSGSLSQNITTIDISNNNLTGSIPSSFSSLPLLQKLSVANNSMNGSIPSTIWQHRTLNSNRSLNLDFSFNRFSNISGSLPAQTNITLGLQGNPLCSSNSFSAVCGPHQDGFRDSLNNTNPSICRPQSCPPPYENVPSPQRICFCAAPLLIGYRLKSPGFSNFAPYLNNFVDYLSTGLNVNAYQLEIDSLAWQEGPRLRMYLKLFPADVNSTVHLFNMSEVWRIQTTFSGWRIHENPVFGPYEFLNFTLTEPYLNELPPPSSGLSNGALAGIIIGTIVGSVIITAFVSIFVMKRHMKKRGYLKKRTATKISMKIDGVKEFTYLEMARATHNFDSSTVVGEGGYGKVHKGILADGTIVAIKHAEEGSLQGIKEFLTEIELLSRLHHRNLVSLIGYCDEQGEQMLIYEFVPNGNLRDHLSGKSRGPLSFGMRVKIALGAARGIFYLHKEANPPIFHRDIKATNILLDSHFAAKVADFGLSRLAPLQDLEGSIPSHVSTVVKGTPGYLDPEYFLTHKLTDKSDVYSLGVVLLELMTAMHPISQGKNIVREVNIAYRSGRMVSVIDEQIGSYPSECMEKFINLALKCCSDETHARPTMAEVVRELDSILMMTTDWDTNFSTSLDSDHSRVGTPPSSSTSASLIANQPYISHEISGSDLVSGVFPTVKPR